VKTFVIDVNTSHTPEEGTYSSSWPKELTTIFFLRLVDNLSLPSCDWLMWLATHL
jgi:hypothetical protein